MWDDPQYMLNDALDAVVDYPQDSEDLGEDGVYRLRLDPRKERAFLVIIGHHIKRLRRGLNWSDGHFVVKAITKLMSLDRSIQYSPSKPWRDFQRFCILFLHGVFPTFTPEDILETARPVLDRGILCLSAKGLKESDFSYPRSVYIRLAWCKALHHSIIPPPESDLWSDDSTHELVDPDAGWEWWGAKNLWSGFLEKGALKFITHGLECLQEGIREQQTGKNLLQLWEKSERYMSIRRKESASVSARGEERGSKEEKEEEEKMKQQQQVPDHHHQHHPIFLYDVSQEMTREDHGDMPAVLRGPGKDGRRHCLTRLHRFSISEIMTVMDQGYPQDFHDRVLRGMVWKGRNLFKVLVEFVDELQAITDHWFSAAMFNHYVRAEGTVGRLIPERHPVFPHAERWEDMIFDLDDGSMDDGQDARWGDRERPKFSPEAQRREEKSLLNTCRALVSAWYLLGKLFPQFDFTPAFNFGFLSWKALWLPFTPEDKSKIEWLVTTIEGGTSSWCQPPQVRGILFWMETRMGSDVVSQLARDSLTDTYDGPAFAKLAFGQAVSEYRLRKNSGFRLYDYLFPDPATVPDAFRVILDELAEDSGPARQLLALNFLRAIRPYPSPNSRENQTPGLMGELEGSCPTLLSRILELRKTSSSVFSVAVIDEALLTVFQFLNPRECLRSFRDLFLSEGGQHGSLRNSSTLVVGFLASLDARIRDFMEAAQPTMEGEVEMKESDIQEEMFDFIVEVFESVLRRDPNLTLFPDIDGGEELPMSLQVENVLLRAEWGAVATVSSFISISTALLQNEKSNFAGRFHQRLWGTCLRPIQERLQSLVEYMQAEETRKKKKRQQQQQQSRGGKKGKKRKGKKGKKKQQSRPGKKEILEFERDIRFSEILSDLKELIRRLRQLSKKKN